MHECPRCGLTCDCSGDWDDFEVMTPEWVFMNCQCDCEGMDYEEDDPISDDMTWIEWHKEKCAGDISMEIGSEFNKVIIKVCKICKPFYE